MTHGGTESRVHSAKVAYLENVTVLEGKASGLGGASVVEASGRVQRPGSEWR